MLATGSAAALPRGPLAYEPKYDGIRALVSIEPAAPGAHGGRSGHRARLEPDRGAPAVRIWSRLGNDKTPQFPEIAAALSAWARSLGHALLLDGEIVALDRAGEPLGFQHLQRRFHGATADRAGADAAFIAFDLLREGGEDLRPLPLAERRTRLERVFAGRHDRRLRISEHTTDAEAIQTRARRDGWEGLLVKRLDSPYQSGRRSPDWRKLKLVRHQTAVVGGWTEPRGSRPFFGALLLGVYDDGGRLQYIGHAGSGFSDAELERVWARLQPLGTGTCPFAEPPPANERPHWVTPSLAAEVKFTEWTEDGRLRHPTYLGLRDDVRPESVRREPGAAAPSAPRILVGAGRVAGDAGAAPPTSRATGALLDRLDRIEQAGGDGVLDLPGGARLEVSNLRKVFWPEPRLTKGDLFRHYVRVAPHLLPVLDGRPLVMKRYPNGVAARPFYQHRAPVRPPAGVRVEPVETGDGRRPHLIGGTLITLLYTAQLAAISQDPWLSRVGSEDCVDHVAIDLDPPERLPFGRVLDVARWVRDELDALGAPAFAKTSGAGGLHVYVPMPPGTPYDAGLLFCQIVATMVARRHPAQATIERSVRARGGRVYLDYMQNARGKTLASAYSVRANEFAGVSTPLRWEEIDAGVSPRDFTLPGVPARLASAGDLWAALRQSPPANLLAVMQYGRSGAG
jgi:bifunctional non-homologous end joining protein LigD